MAVRVTVLGAGFGGLELSSTLSEALGGDVEVTLIEHGEAFVFGFSKLDVMFGLASLEQVRLPYERFSRPNVRLARETVTAIDPQSRRVTTGAGTYDCDFLVVALGVGYDLAATPGLAQHGNEFYSVDGANALRELLPSFRHGHAIVGVSAAPYKCPPAPSECALMLHDHLLARGVRQDCSITLVLPLPSPVPPSPETSKALMQAFAERDIRFLPNRRVASLDARHVATLDDGTELPYDLYFGVPRHRAPAVVEASGLTVDGWIPVNARTLETKFANVFAVGDIANTGTPKAGVFAEGAARAVASRIIAAARGASDGSLYSGAGTCYIEFGGGRIGRVDVDFFSGPKPTGHYYEPAVEQRVHKEEFGASRRARWFGL